MYYLSGCNRSPFKSYYCYFLFLPFEKYFKHYGKYFWFPSLYILEKNFLVNRYKKQLCYKANLCHDVMKNGQMFSSKVIFNMIADSFLVEKWGTLERARRCICKML